MNIRNLRDHVAATYFTLRIGIAVLAFALPWVLLIAGWLWLNLGVQQSMSAYYHAGNGALRDVFVGILCAIGAFLYLYKGYTSFENHALNLAGLFLLGVAWVPMEWDCGTACQKITWHGTLSVLFFLAIAYVCIFRASDTLGIMTDETKRRWFKRAYQGMGAAMIAFPAAAFVLSLPSQGAPGTKPQVFWVEAVGVMVFAAYWILKSREIAITHSEREAIAGTLRTPPSTWRDVFRSVAVDRLDALPKA